MGKASKDKRDVYYRQAKEEGWRARSAFKLLQINEEFNIFENVHNIVDLCAAPGSWSQVLSRTMEANKNQNAKIVAVDLQPMAPLPGVISLQGDITDENTVTRILKEFKELADLVVFDGAPDVTGIHDLDEFIQSQLVFAALNISSRILKKGGTFVGKIFRGSDSALLESQLLLLFKEVIITKPRSSRNSSTESFVICRGFELPGVFPRSFVNPLLQNTNCYWDNLSEISKQIIPFTCCGDLNAFDSDKGDLLELTSSMYGLMKPEPKDQSERGNITKYGEFLSKADNLTDSVE